MAETSDWTEVSAWSVLALFVRVLFACAVVVAFATGLAYLAVSVLCPECLA